MKEQTKHFDECVYESVISGGVDFYKITSPLVNITEASEKSSGRLVGGLVENDTINDTINSLSDNERTVFEEMQAHPKVTANELSEILNINLRNTKMIIEKLKEKGLVQRMGSRKTGHWEVVEK
ncbi:MAG TPA: MarR family transcriptional regulator [Methanosarcinaceae archaeon]|nr:MarR family transcriptional regulator [Methanosarcinaceae archaeon]